MTGLPEDAQRLVDDHSYRTKAGEGMAEALRGRYTSTVKNAVGEVRELKGVGPVVKKLALRQGLDKHDKRALGGAAKVIGRVVAGVIAVGGVSPLAAAGLATHFVTEALAGSLFAEGRWPIYESDAGAVREVVERVIDKTIRGLDGLGSMPDKQLVAIMAKAHEGQTVAAKEPEATEPSVDAGQAPSGERDWKPGPHNRWVPDELPGRS